MHASPLATLEQLRVFIAVAEQLHVTRAAAALNMTQSAASAAIQALETRLGTTLLERVGRHIELSEAGRVFLPEAKTVLSKAFEAEQALAELEGLVRGRLRLWASHTIAGYWLPPYLHRFHVAYPRVELEVRIANSMQVSHAVLVGEADLGFVEGDIEEPLLVHIPVAVDQLVLIVAASHELASIKSMKIADLHKLRWVLREPGAGTRQIFEKALREYGTGLDELQVGMELPSNEAVRSAVEAGAGATVISRLVVAKGLAEGTLTELPLAFPERRYLALRHGDRRRSRAGNALLEMIRKPPSDAACA
jgi:DNA-binding transcriptional LysR family regulator